MKAVTVRNEHHFKTENKDSDVDVLSCCPDRRLEGGNSSQSRTLLSNKCILTTHQTFVIILRIPVTQNNRHNSSKIATCGVAFCTVA